MSEAFWHGVMGALAVAGLLAALMAIAGAIYTNGYQSGIESCGLAGKP